MKIHSKKETQSTIETSLYVRPTEPAELLERTILCSCYRQTLSYLNYL